MALFRKKPVIIEAHQLPPAGVDPDMALLNFLCNCPHRWTSEREGTIAIETLEGTMTAEPGDWIICGVKGEYYPCKPDIFAATYERAD